MALRCTQSRLPHRFPPGSKLFSGRSSAGSPSGPGRTTPATWSTPRCGACSVPRDHPTPAPDSPARRQAVEVKMVGYITIAHGAAQRLSKKWRHCACALLSSLFCTSPFCVGVPKRDQGRGTATGREASLHCGSRSFANFQLHNGRTLELQRTSHISVATIERRRRDHAAHSAGDPIWWLDAAGMLNGDCCFIARAAGSLRNTRETSAPRGARLCVDFFEYKDFRRSCVACSAAAVRAAEVLKYLLATRV